MDSIVSIMQQVAAREVEKIYTTEIGIVTAIFPHESESDKNNYQCSVNLKNRKKADGADFELRQVPITTGHIGTVQIPNVGDLVVIAFINGDLNAPVIIGRLYNDADMPPLSKKDEWVIEKVESIKIKMIGGSTLEIDKDGNVKIEAKKDITIKAEGNVTINDGANGAARKNDSVEVTIPPGSFIIAVAGMAVGTPNPAPVKVQGTITSGSEKVKIG
jgi:phage baseplate assembly protein gpV